MATYAVGDIQGCHDELLDLLELLRFDPTTDRLWLCGDLVNRGPASAAVLRTIMSFGDAAITVLGNHDLHCLALGSSAAPAPRRRDTVSDVLTAPDRDQLLGWLAGRPLFHADPTLDFAMVHAGIPPQWSVAEAQSCAREVASVLATPAGAEAFFSTMYGNDPVHWEPTLSGADRLRYIANALTRMRYCRQDGALDLDEKGAPGNAGAALVPWFAAPRPVARTTRIVFGHWSTLTLSAEACARYRVWPLDTGAVWGGRLSAMRLEDCHVVSVPSRQPRAH